VDGQRLVEQRERLLGFGLVELLVAGGPLTKSLLGAVGTSSKAAPE
jgi:hypothetical protein